MSALCEPEEIIEIAGDDHKLRHALFARLCLGWDWKTATFIGIENRKTPLDVDTMNFILRTYQERSA